MNLVIFGLTVSSSRGNGHAHHLARALSSAGFEAAISAAKTERPERSVNISIETDVDRRNCDLLCLQHSSGEEQTMNVELSAIEIGSQVYLKEGGDPSAVFATSAGRGAARLLSMLKIPASL